MKFFNWIFSSKNKHRIFEKQLLLKLCLLQKKQNSLKITHLKK